MKKIILATSLILLLLSCSKDNTNIEPILNITKSTWFTKTSGNSGMVLLVISGSTNADKVTVETYGDGEIGVYNVVLDLKNNFSNDTIGISFTYFPSTPPSGQFQSSTKIRAVKGDVTFVETLTSGQLSFE